ncbi:unnamed protein product [Ectocarpus sp. CCAP 1310/34]|nr:unnamed protein product [Ectocarpus sp. CCAP 1310/34]
MDETYTSEAEAEGGGSRGGGGFGGGGRSGSGDGYASGYRQKVSLSSSSAASDGSSAEASALATPATCRNSRSTARRSYVSFTTTTTRAYSGSSRASTPAREQSASLGLPAPFLDNGDTGKSNDSDDSYSGRGGSCGGVGGDGGGGKRLSVRGRARNNSCSGSDDSGSEGGEKVRDRSSLGRRVSVGIPKISRSKTAELPSGGAGEPSATVTAGSAVRLSAEASAILSAQFPPEVGSDSSARTGWRTAVQGAAATEEGAPLTLPPHPAPALKRFATAGEVWQGKPKELIFPLAWDRAVSPRWMEVRYVAATSSERRVMVHDAMLAPSPVSAAISVHLARWLELESSALPEKPAVNIKAAGARMLKRLGSQIEFFWASGDESDSKQEEITLRTSRRVARTRNPLHLFHVCPLLLHEKLCDGGGRPVHKFVFACPGTAAALVGSMEGVCHFKMRLTQEAGMTVVERAYNAFAVRVLDEEGKRRVVPALESSEGVLCVEMRIRLYPDGLMSGLLARLIKVVPTVAITGHCSTHKNHKLFISASNKLSRSPIGDRPTNRSTDGSTYALDRLFWEERSIRVSPTIRAPCSCCGWVRGGGHQNLDNPAVQLQGPFLQHRLTPPPAHRNVVMIAAGTGVNPSECNSVEADLYCTDELTALQAKANGLLEVTALISGDNTRRNVPGNAFRHAKARLMKKGAAAGLVPLGEREVDSDTGDAKDDDDDALPANLPRLWSVSELSCVSEEDSSHTRGSQSTLSLGLFVSAGSRDLETGGGGGGGDLGRENTISEEERAGVGGDVPWSASDTAADTRRKAGKHRQHGDGGGGGLATSSSAAAKNARSTFFAGGGDDGGGDGSGGGRSKSTPPRSHSSYRSNIGTRNGAADDSSGNGQGPPPKAVGAQRKGRRWASRDGPAMRGARQPGGSPLDDVRGPKLCTSVGLLVCCWTCVLLVSLSVRLP